MMKKDKIVKFNYFEGLTVSIDAHDRFKNRTGFLKTGFKKTGFFKIGF
jgi:hypothetical protein